MDYQPQPTPTIFSSDPQFTPQIEPKNNRKKIALLALIVVVIISALTAAILLLQKPSSKDIYLSAVSDAVSRDSGELYGSFDVDSENTNFSGELLGDLQSKERRLRADISVSSVLDGTVPMSLKGELIAIEENEISEGYLKYESVTSSNSTYRQNLEGYFAPVINKWIKLGEKKIEKGERSVTFEEDGALAAFELTSVFAPVAGLNKNDQEVFITAVKEYSLYEIDETIENTRIKGMDARKVKVSIQKDVFLDFEKEVNRNLSEDAEFQVFDSEFVDQVFGSDDMVTADVYLSEDEAVIIGVEYDIDLDEPVIESSFETRVERISVSFFIEYNQDTTIDKPKNAITTEQMGQLLTR